MDLARKRADLFVDNLLSEGSKEVCDDSSDSFNNQHNLPSFYDEELFKRGQEFYHRNIFALFGAKIFGLVSVLSIPSILRILTFTKMSEDRYSSYKRYVATVLHMNIWYESNFKPGSKLWASIAEVRRLHNSASNRSCKAGLHRISQKDMALTQFGFMGYQMIKKDYFGIYNGNDEDWKAFLHLWRVVGHLLGIEDRFNICRGSLDETRAICQKLLERVFIPHIQKNDPEFLYMSRILVEGLWALQPVLNFNVILCMLHVFFYEGVNNTDLPEYKKLAVWEKCLFYFVKAVFYSLRWAPTRWYFNHTRHRDNWLIQNFPFLAYYKYGFENTVVRILRNEKVITKK
ncbi:hypothetical protein ABEB36_002065 [Hypothenemus hampei]|uniref:ER-bound oxygenase mpaB/mpaB'/Rubber oxygenase catalytic domain-containing protein n=1 Tax=Hypothenemus hampei TaxID=57062 RepID=A0ABD1F723_HYPHA